MMSLWVKQDTNTMDYLLYCCTGNYNAKIINGKCSPEELIRSMFQNGSSLLFFAWVHENKKWRQAGSAFGT